MRPRLDVAIDPVTRRILRGWLILEPEGSIEIHLPYRLESPNKFRHGHWTASHRDRAAWHARLKAVIADAAGLTSLGAFHQRELEALGLTRATSHRRVVIERQVPSARNFIRDDDNRAFCAKRLMDALTALGFIRDDASRWTSLEVIQRVSDDGRDWTVVRIEIPVEGQMPLMAEAVAEKVRQRR